eukprot:363717-Chlamydomonas_euryale.AAC.3
MVLKGLEAALAACLPLRRASGDRKGELHAHGRKGGNTADGHCTPAEQQQPQWQQMPLQLNAACCGAAADAQVSSVGAAAAACVVSAAALASLLLKAVPSGYGRVITSDPVSTQVGGLRAAASLQGTPAAASLRREKRTHRRRGDRGRGGTGAAGKGHGFCDRDRSTSSEGLAALWVFAIRAGRSRGLRRARQPKKGQCMP